MGNKATSLSIGIPAYNEEDNIKKLLFSLLDQKMENYTLKEIIVVSDCSTDNTDKEVESVGDSRIKLLKNKKRSGQAVGQNKIVDLFVGDILILLNADVLPSEDSFISELIKPIQENKNIALVGPRIVPLKAKTFFEKIINYSVEFKDFMAESWHTGDNLYLCSGRGRAFRKEFAKKIHWKNSLSEDAFSYLVCIKEGYEFKYEPSAVLFFKSPDNFRDHMKQSARFVSGSDVMTEYFNKSLVEKEYVIPKKIVIQAMVKYFWKNPFLFLLYLTVFLKVKITPGKSQHVNTRWEISKSSKKLNT